ncbi:MAG: Hsp20/alpha crystallin family protein [Gaiellaceae bacterium]
MDDLFNDLWQLPRSIGSRGGFLPAVDLYRREDPAAVVAVVELAGVDPDDVEIAVADGQLLIAGHRRRRVEGQRVLQLEIEHGEFSRQVALPEDVDASAAVASFDRGLLTITLPVAQRAVVRRSVTITMTRAT